jgi:hypothetical protein
MPTTASARQFAAPVHPPRKGVRCFDTMGVQTSALDEQRNPIVFPLLSHMPLE